MESESGVPASYPLGRVRNRVAAPPVEPDGSEEGVARAMATPLTTPIYTCKKVLTGKGNR